MKMLKKGSIALTLLGVCLLFAAAVEQLRSFGAFSELANGLINLGLLATASGTAGRVIAICYEKWVGYRNHPVKSASPRRFTAVKSVFDAVTVFGTLIYLSPILNPAEADIYAELRGLLLVMFGGVGFFFTWVLGVVYDFFNRWKLDHAT